VQSDIGSKNSF